MITMPNAINRFKPNQLIKVDKENENKDIKRKLKGLGARPKVTAPISGYTLAHPPRHLVEKCLPVSSKHETVWERLSKVKKCASNEGNLGLPTKSRAMLQSKSAHRLQVARSTVPKPAKKPLTPTTNFNRRVADKPLRKVKLSKSIYMTQIQPEIMPFLSRPDKPVKEIMTARSICNSKSSSDGSKNSSKRSTARSTARSNDSDRNSGIVPVLYDCEEPDDTDLEHAVESNDSNEKFEVAPLIPVPTTDSLSLSTKISANFRCILAGKQRSMASDEIILIKDMVKTDRRHQGLHQGLHHENSSLFKDILKKQLKEILRQETVVKSALNNLDVAIDESSAVISVENANENAFDSDGSQRKPQVDVIFKNVPTLEKEIIILKALGEKLEATLRRTMSQPTYGAMELSQTTNFWEWCWSQTEQWASSTLTLRGIRLCAGIIKEYRMVHKTIVELKEHSSHHFYLPSSRDSTELKRTSFRRLKQNPDLLFRHLRPKNSLVPFNVLEQDPIFFNSFINPPARPEYSESSSLAKVESYTAASTTSGHAREAGDNVAVRVPTSCHSVARRTLETLAERQTVSSLHLSGGDVKNRVICVDAQTSHSKQLSVVGVKPVSEKPVFEKPVFETPVRGKQRRRIRRHFTPVRVHKMPVEPKNSLLKTILVGSVQISVFLLLIMAITYPDIKC